MNLERKAHSSIVIKHRCQNNHQHQQDPRNQNLNDNDDNANKPHPKNQKKNPQEINKNKQAKAKPRRNYFLCKILKFGRTRTHRGVRTESKKISANRNKRGRSKNKPKKGTNVADTRKIEGKKLRAMRKKGRKRMRERKRRGIFAHFCFHPNLVISSSSKCDRGGETEERRCSTPICTQWSLKISFSHP
jgi:hypothetical protein